MNRRSFIRVAGGGAILAALPTVAACSSRLPDEAIAAWRGPIDESDIRRWILSYALLAPHSHNLQSWLVDLGTPDELTLYCDDRRLLPETDPQSRQIMLSHGTFLELLDLAAKERGVRTEIELFPEGEFDTRPDRRPIARVRFVADPAVKQDPLFAQILKRRTNRKPYALDPISPAAIAAIQSSVALNPVRIGFADRGSHVMDRHRAIAAAAWRIELETPRTVLESYRVLRIGPDEIARHRDGIVVNDRLPRMLAGLGLFDRSKAPTPGDATIRKQVDDFDDLLRATPAFFWLTTQRNDRTTQVNAGRAYVRAQLAATAHGVSMHPLSQALQEYPEQATPYKEIHELVGAAAQNETVQMWTRLGVGPDIEPSPRRALREFIVGAPG